MLETTEEIAKIYHIKFGKEKSQILTLSSKYPITHMQMGDMKLASTKTYKYLGTMMTGGSIFAFIKLTLYVDIFMGGAYNVPELLIKTFALYMVPVFYGWVNPRYRTEQAIRWFWGWPTIIGIIAVLFAAWFN